ACRTGRRGLADAGSIPAGSTIKREGLTRRGGPFAFERTAAGLASASGTDGERGVSRRMRRAARTTSAYTREAPGERTRPGPRLQARARPARAVPAGSTNTKGLDSLQALFLCANPGVERGSGRLPCGRRPLRMCRIGPFPGQPSLFSPFALQVVAGPNPAFTRTWRGLSAVNNGHRSSAEHKPDAGAREHLALS